MKKGILLIALFAALTAHAGNIALPAEKLALPDVSGSHLVCIWDESANDWHTGFVEYDHSGSLNFQLPEWGRWYWVGLWDVQTGQYVYSKWVGHFISS